MASAQQGPPPVRRALDVGWEEALAATAQEPKQSKTERCAPASLACFVLCESWGPRDRYVSCVRVALAQALALDGCGLRRRTRRVHVGRRLYAILNPAVLARTLGERAALAKRRRRAARARGVDRAAAL